MDGEEIMTFAALGGVARLPPWSEHEHAFGIAVWRAVDKYDLHELFTHAPSCRPPPSYHALRPRGFDWTSPEWPEIPGAILQWRRQYKSLSLARQLVAATVLTLYRGEVDRVWLNRVPKAWPAADGIVALRDAGALMDWTELVALYPGW